MTEPDSNLISRLRKIAADGTTINRLVNEIRQYLGTDDGLPLVVDRYFCEAFHLPLGEVRAVEGSECLGRTVYSHDEIDCLLLPKIEATKQLWGADTPGGHG